MSPFNEALDFIKKHPGTSSAIGLSKLILSLYNEYNAFSLSECVKSFDRENLDLALRMIKNYFENGETNELINVGHEVFELTPDLKELSHAASDAKAEVR
jgi:hypothetical protein